MEKPFSIARAEFTEKLIADVNESGLPPSVLLDIVGNLAKLLEQKAQEAFEADMAAYKQAEKEEKKKGAKR